MDEKINLNNVFELISNDFQEKIKKELFDIIYEKAESSIYKECQKIAERVILENIHSYYDAENKHAVFEMKISWTHIINGEKVKFNERN